MARCLVTALRKHLWPGAYQALGREAARLGRRQGQVTVVPSWPLSARIHACPRGRPHSRSPGSCAGPDSKARALRLNGAGVAAAGRPNGSTTRSATTARPHSCSAKSCRSARASSSRRVADLVVVCCQETPRWAASLAPRWAAALALRWAASLALRWAARLLVCLSIFVYHPRWAWQSPLTVRWEGEETSLGARAGA